MSDTPSPHIRRFALRPDVFRRHLTALVENGCTALTVSEFLAIASDPDARLPERPALVTFDDGYADFADQALPLLLEYRIRPTLYVTTGFLAGALDERAVTPPGAMLAWSQLSDLVAQRVEIGGHTHTHPQLDVVSLNRADDEIRRCKALLEDALASGIQSFAYPHGYSSASVRELVRKAGYTSACSVKNALSSPADDRFSLARLMIHSTTSTDQVERWLQGTGAPPAPTREAPRTRAWRLVRSVRARATRTGS